MVGSLGGAHDPLLQPQIYSLVLMIVYERTHRTANNGS